MTDAKNEGACGASLSDAGLDTIENAQRRAEYWKAEHLAANSEIERLRIHVAECEAVLRQLTNPGWVNDALASGSVERIASDICALKRQARGVLNG